MHLSKLSIVIPTLNRHKYLLRNMKYWSGAGVQVYILDGSESAIDSKLQSCMKNNIHYMHLPLMLYNERIKKVIPLLDTKYTAFLSDDEFFVHSGLEALMEKLEMNPELVSCMGRCLFFDFYRGEVLGLPAYKEMENYTVVNDDAIQRMIDHMSSYTCSSMYSVVRTPVWKKAISPFLEKEFPVYALFELQFELAVCFQGKSMVLPVLLWLRSKENETLIDSSLSFIRNNSFVDWWNEPTNILEKDSFLEIMSSTLSDGSSFSKKEIEVGIVNSLDCYYSDQLLKQKESSKKRISIVNVLAKCMPKTVKHNLKKVIPSSFFGKYNRGTKNIVNVAYDLSNTGVKVDTYEVKKIKTIVKLFHNKIYN